MTEQDIINAYEFFKKNNEYHQKTKNEMIKKDVKLSAYYDNLAQNYYVAFRIIEAYASKKGLISSDK